ncbi:MAG: PAS domain S-box protein [Bacteroidales bacterium]|nr:PAS domain S-box protein [Bacteroidales bacterium]
MQPISVMKINKFNLSFPDTLEKKYRAYYFRESLKFMRIAIVCVAVVYSLFVFLDAALVPYQQQNFLFIRFGAILPFLAIVLILSFLNFFEKIWQWVLFATYIVMGAGIVAMIKLVPENLTYYPGLMLVYMAGYFFLRLRFVQASIAGWIIMLLFNGIIWGFTEVPQAVIMAFNFFFISANLIGMMAAYYIEFNKRKSFFLSFQLDRKKLELEQSNKNLEHEVAKRTCELASSEERFRTVFDHSGVGIAILNADGIILHTNHALCNFLGYNQEDILGDSIPLISHPEDLNTDRQLFAELVDGKRLKYEMDKRYIHKHGHIIWGCLSVTKVTENHDGQPLFISMVADINAQKQNENALQHERIYYEHLFESAPVGIVLLSNEDVILDCNKDFTSLFQYTKEDVQGKPINSLIVPEQLKQEASGISFSIAHGKEIYSESTRKRKDGSLVDVAITGKPVFVNSGQEAIYGIYQDISERKKTELELNRRMAFQEYAVKVSTRFASTLNLDTDIIDTLAEIGSLSQADRSYLFLIRKDEQLVDNTHEWCAPGIEPQIENLIGIPISLMPWWMEKLYADETIMIEDVGNLPAGAEAEKQLLEQQDIKSVLVLPVNVEGKLKGFIGFDFVKKHMSWSDSDLAILKITAEVMGHALGRTQFRQALLYERDLLQALMDNIPDTIYFKDIESRFTRINKAQAKVLGVSSTDDAIGKTDFDFFNTEHAQITYDDEQKVLRKGEAVIGKLEYFKTGGKWRWMSATKVPIRDEQGNVVGLVGVSHDVTEQKIIEDKLRSREQFLSHLNEITNLSLKTLGSQDLFNLLAIHMHSLLSSDISFITLWDSETNKIVPVAGSGIDENSLRGFRYGTDQITMTESVLKTGKVLVAGDVLNSPYISPSVAAQFPSKSLLGLPLIAYGKKMGAVLIGFSKTHHFTEEEIELGTMAAYQIALVVARTRMLEQLVSNEKELRKLNAEKDKLFTVIAHDLRSPFTSFLGLTELMTDETIELSMDEMREFAQSIQKAANGLYQLLENLLEWSRTQSGSSEFKPQLMRANTIIRESLGFLKAAADRKQIEIINRVPEDLIIHGDQKMLRSITGNLISNAIKFTGRCGKVEILANSHNGNHVQFEIKDNGIGMNKDIICKLFRIDMKVSSQGTEGEPSSGLGLILCKEFIEKHGGKIWVESNLDVGTSFFFTLPKQLEEASLS